MTSNGMLWFIVWGGLPLTPFAQCASRTAPVASDPLELAAGKIQPTGAFDRKAALDLLARARGNYALRRAGLGYDLKIVFTTDSLGQTNYDGAWELEDLFLPGHGLHWTAHAAAGYSITGISTNGELYSDGSDENVPLRLEEARGILLHPLPSADYASRESIRTTTAPFQGTTVTCILLSTAKKLDTPTLGRAWEESEECIDPQTGFLMMHSEAPGRYVVYDYANAAPFHGQTLPRRVTVHEGGRVVSTLTVQQLEEVNQADQDHFLPTDRMRAKGRSVELTAATKISRVHGQAASGMIVRPVCVFGLVTPGGQLVEAHSLQPSDPNSQAAVEDAKGINFSAPSGSPPRQHFVFVIEKFISR
jgi:hypothetical protein